MRDPDPSALHGNYGPFIQGLAMVVDDILEQGDPLGHPDIWQAYQAGVGCSVQMYEFSEIFIHRDEDPVFRCGLFQQGRVPGVWPQAPGIENVVSAALEPICQSASCAPVHYESHGPVTETGANVSPDITVWA